MPKFSQHRQIGSALLFRTEHLPESLAYVLNDSAF